MKEYGGFLPIELSGGDDYFKCKHMAVNTGRAALAAALLLKKPLKVYTPLYMCDSLDSVYQRLGIDYEHYNIGNDFMPIGVTPKKNELVYWTYYFGAIPHYTVETIINQYKDKLLLDRAQAFFGYPPTEHDKHLSMFSCRKFFGVPDGAYLCGNIPDEFHLSFEKCKSAESFKYLLDSFEQGTNSIYSKDLENTSRLGDGYYLMSDLTQKVLRSLDFDTVRIKRRKNYLLIHRLLGKYNELPIDEQAEGMMVYPFLFKSDSLRKHLLDNHVWVSQWWKHVANHENANEWEKYISQYLIPLPIDQRYCDEDVKNISDIVLYGIDR